MWVHLIYIKHVDDGIERCVEVIQEIHNLRHTRHNTHYCTTVDQTMHT